MPNNSATTTFNVVIDGTVANKTALLDTNATIDNLTITGGGTLSFNSSFDLTVAGTSIDNAGTISLNAAGFATDLNLADVSLTGGGTIAMANNASNEILGIASTNRLTNVNNTIRGSGNISGLAMTNHGTIVANQSTPLLVYPTGTQNFNTGLMQAAGGTLQLQGGGTTVTVLDNISGTIEATNGSVVRLMGISIHDGVLQTSGTGRIETPGFYSATLSNVALSGNYVGSSASTTNISGTIENSGTISIRPAGFATRLILMGGSTVTLNGSGRVELVGHDALAEFTPATNAEILVNNSTIRGRGFINLLTMYNNGTIAGDVSGSAFYVSPYYLANNGTILANGGGSMIITPFHLIPTLTNTGTLLADDGSTISLQGSLVVNGGTLRTFGSGVIETVAGATASLVNVTLNGAYAGRDGSNTLISGAISNSGSITVQSTSSAATLRLSGGSTVTLSGGGSVNLNGPNARIEGAGTLVNANNLIHGQGLIGVNTIAMLNQGTVRADVNGQGLSLNPFGGGLTNTGTLQASGGGILELTGWDVGEFYNTGGRIESLDGSRVQFVNSAVVRGGTLATAGSGTISARPGYTGYLVDTHLAGNIIAESSSVLDMSGAVTNTGTVRAMGSGTVRYNGVSGGSFNSHAGTMQIDSGGIATMLNSPVFDIGYINDNGEFYSRGTGSVGTISGTGSVIVIDGSLEVDFLSHGGLTVNSALTIRHQTTPTIANRITSLRLTLPCVLELNDNDLIIDYTTTSPFTIVKDAITSGYHGGNWDGDGIRTSMGDELHIGLGYAESSKIFGTFPATFCGQSVDSTTVLVKYTYYGDATLDGKVDVMDLYALAVNWQSPVGLWNAGDFNYDGLINAADLGLMAMNWQAGVAAPLGIPIDAAAAGLGLPMPVVPEPPAVALLAAPILLVLSRRRMFQWRPEN